MSSHLAAQIDRTFRMRCNKITQNSAKLNLISVLTAEMIYAAWMANCRLYEEHKICMPFSKNKISKFVIKLDMKIELNFMNIFLQN